MPLNVAALTQLTTDIYDKAVIDYDREADVLHVNFEPGTPADASKIVDDILVRYAADGRMIGFTLLNASEHNR